MINLLKGGVLYFIQEFIGQIVAAVIILIALLAWFYFSSVYAAIAVVLGGLVIWGLVAKAFDWENKK